MYKVTRMKRFILVIILILFGIYLYYDAVSNRPPVTESRLMMDTIITVKAYSPNANEAIEACFNTFKEIENEVSYHIATSSLSNLNISKTGKKESHLASIIDLCQKYEKITEGYFDPTFSSITELYGFYGNVPSEIPDDETLNNVLENKIGLSKHLKTEADTYKLSGETKLDLGGAAGGYALRLSAQKMLETGCKSFLIDDSGDIYVIGKKPNGLPWKVAVKNPYDNSQIAVANLISGQAVSTSGNYERFVSIKGKNYGHIMNPETGKPAEDFSSVTVIAENPEEADIMSTTLFAMPKDKSIKKAEELKLAVLFVTSDKKIIMSSKGKETFQLMVNSLQ